MAFTCKLGVKSADGYTYINFKDGVFIFSNKNVKTTLYNVAFNRKVYSPNELIADVSISVVKESDSEKIKKQLEDIDDAELETVFLNRFVAVEFIDNTNDDRTQTFENLYIQQYIPLREQDHTLYVRLKAYSLDYQLTQREFCHSYVAKRLYADILNKEVDSGNTKKLWINDKLADKNRPITLADNAKRQHMNYGDGKEPILPYLVQYNESFYDFLCRTANRCGEFLFFDEGRLSYGVNTEAKTTLNDPNDASKTYTITYDSTISYGECSQSFGKKLEHVDNDYYSLAREVNGAYDLKLEADDWETNWIRDYGSEHSRELAKKSLGNSDKASKDELEEQAENDDNIPKSVGENDMKYDFEINEEEHHTKIFKKKLSSFTDFVGFPNKYVAGFFATLLKQNSVYNIIKTLIKFPAKSLWNAQQTANEMQMRWQKQAYDRLTNGEDYLPINKDLQEKDDAISPFVGIEDGAAITNVQYQKIRKGELAASEKAMIFNLGTNFKKLKLGQKIKVGKTEYVVVQIKIKPAANQAKFIGIDKDYPEDFDSMSNSHMQVIAVPMVKVGDDKEEKIYPPMYPKGHVRHADPQVAFVPTHGYMDPRMQGRLRIYYPWDSKKNVSPWLRVMVPAATSGGGYYAEAGEGDEVLVCYIAGNVERPYIGGFLRNKNKTLQYKRGDMYMISKNGHGITFNDPVDPSLFFEGVSPAFKTVKSFFHMIPGINGSIFGAGIDAEDSTKGSVENLIKLTGGTTIKDAFGIYSINMSTDQRTIDINSPYGKVGLNAFTGITVSAPNGDISIKGKNVSIEAANSLSLVSGKNVKDGFYDPIRRDGWAMTMAKLGADLAADIVNDLQPVDMELLRCVVEIFLHPISGTLQIKSHNYLLLEAGNGEATIRPDRYKENTDVKSKLIEKTEGLRKKELALFGAMNKVNEITQIIMLDLKDKCIAAKNSKARYDSQVEDLINSDGVKSSCIKSEGWISEIFGKDPNTISVEANYKFLVDDVNYKKFKFTTNVFIASKLVLFNLAKDFISKLIELSKCRKNAIKNDNAIYASLVTSANMDAESDFLTIFYNDLKAAFIDEMVALSQDFGKEKWSDLSISAETLESSISKMKHRVFAKMIDKVKDKEDCFYIIGTPYNKDTDNWKEYIQSLKTKNESSVGALTGDKLKKDLKDALAKPYVSLYKTFSDRDAWASGKPGQIIFSDSKDKSYYFDTDGSYHDYVNGSSGDLRQILIDL